MFLVFLFLWTVCFLDVIIYYIQKNYKEPKEEIKEKTTHSYIHISQNPNMYYAHNLYDILYPIEGDLCTLPNHKVYVYHDESWFEI